MRDVRKNVDPVRSDLFSKLMNSFGLLLMKRSEQMQVVKEATGRECDSIAELTVDEMRATLKYIGVEEGGAA